MKKERNQQKRKTKNKRLPKKIKNSERLRKNYVKDMLRFNGQFD